jgi:hypothetical protein
MQCIPCCDGGREAATLMSQEHNPHAKGIETRKVRMHCPIDIYIFITAAFSTCAPTFFITLISAVFNIIAFLHIFSHMALCCLLIIVSRRLLIPHGVFTLEGGPKQTSHWATHHRQINIVPTLNTTERKHQLVLTIRYVEMPDKQQYVGVLSFAI